MVGEGVEGVPGPGGIDYEQNRKQSEKRGIDYDKTLRNGENLPVKHQHSTPQENPGRHHMRPAR